MVGVKRSSTRFSDVKKKSYVRFPYIIFCILRSICASTSHDAEGGQVDAELKTVYAVVLPFCATCKSEGAKIVVGRYLPNGQTILKRLDHERQAPASKQRG